MRDLTKVYEQRGPALQRARRRLQSILVGVVASIKDKTLVRAEVTSLRVKGLSSLKRKAVEKGWKAEEALSACSDLIGGRVVCNNIEDVYRFAELLKEQLPSAWGEFEIQDHIKNPNAGGYRALMLISGSMAASIPYCPTWSLAKCKSDHDFRTLGRNCLTTISTSSQASPRICALGLRIWRKCSRPRIRPQAPFERGWRKKRFA